MLVLWLPHLFFHDTFSFPALRVLPRLIFGKSSLCLWFLISVKAGARAVAGGVGSRSTWASRTGGAEQQVSGFWTESLGWDGKTGEDWQLRIRNLGRHFKGMGWSRVGETEFSSCSHMILSWTTPAVSGQAEAGVEEAGGCALREGLGGMGLHWDASTLFPLK